MRRALLAALVVLAAAGALLGRVREPREIARPPDDLAVAPPREPEAPALASAPARRADDVPPRPRSLRGTRPDGGLLVDADGRFVPTLDARRLFDYFLTGSGEMPDADLAARIRHEIARRLPPDAARDATALFERYLAYRERVRALATDAVPDGDDLAARLAMLVALRREMLGPEAAEAFFAVEEAEARRMIEARRLADDPSLSAEERAARVEELFAAAEAELPAEVREARATARLATTIREAEAEIRARGGDPEEIAAMRERLAGPEAAARLAELDRQRRAWSDRVDAFRTARERIAQDASLAPDARAAAIARLLEESFTPPERRRVEALDRIAADAAVDAR